MRRIRSKEHRKKGERVNQLIVGVVLIGLMGMSVVGFGFLSSDTRRSEKITYNEIEFIKSENDYWEFRVSGNEFVTSYNPRQTEDINLDFLYSIQNINNQPLYFVTDNGFATNELINNVGRFAQRYQEVCLEGLDCNQDLVVKDCSNNVIIFVESNKTKIYKQDSCIFINAPYDEQVLASDRLIFKLLGVQ